MAGGYDKWADGIPSGYDVPKKTKAQEGRERRKHEKEVAKIKAELDERLEEAKERVSELGLNELNVDNNGELTLEGRIIDARPIGSPKAYSIKPCYRIAYDLPEIEASFLNEIAKGNIPKNADAFCKSEFELRFEGGYSLAVQWYKVMEK